MTASAPDPEKVLEELSFNGPFTARPTQETEVEVEVDLEDIADAPIDLIVDECPSYEAPPQTDYRDWKHEDTKVVVYTTNPDLYPKDRPATSSAAARAECQAIYGRILETNSVPHRYFFRVWRVRREA